MRTREIKNPLPLSMPGVFRKGGERQWRTQCPYCGGEDRLCLWQDERRKGGFRFWCRQCDRKGDTIDLLREVEGLTYPQACQRLGIVIDEKFKERMKSSRQAMRPAPARAASPPRQEWKLPNQQWSRAAASFLRFCQCDFQINWNSPAEGELIRMAAIYGIGDRQLTPGGCLETGIGINEADFLSPRAEWGLSIENDWRGKARELIRIPEGIVIATRRNGAIVGMTIRRPDFLDLSAGKYKEIPADGSKFPYLIGEPGQPLVITEGAFDAALVYERSRRINRPCAALALHGASKLKLDPEAMCFIERAPKLVLAYDRDDGGRAAAARLQARFAKAVLAPAGGYKDLTDLERAFENGESSAGVEDWLKWALELKPETASP